MRDWFDDGKGLFFSLRLIVRLGEVLNFFHLKIG